MLEDEAPMLELPIASVRVLVDARQVDAIADEEEIVGARHDLAFWLGVPSGEGTRRALRLARGGTWVLVGDRVVVRKVADAAHRPLPRWLDAVGGRLMVDALVALGDGTFGLAMDLEHMFGGGDDMTGEPF